MNGYTRGFCCECWTEDLTETEQPAFHSSFDAHSAGQADRWIAIALRTITPAGTGPQSLRRSLGMAVRGPH